MGRWAGRQAGRRAGRWAGGRRSQKSEKAWALVEPEAGCCAGTILFLLPAMLSRSDNCKPPSVEVNHN